MSSRLLRTSVRFATVGMFNTVLTIVVIFALKAFAGTPDLWANATGYAIGLLCSFVLNKRWTFEHRDSLLPALAKFLSVFALAYVLNIAVVLALIDAGFNDYLSHLAGMPVYTVAFYFGCLLFAFPQPSREASQRKTKTMRPSIAAPLLWCLILLGIISFKLQPSWEPLRSNDSYQYLSMADNLQHGLLARSSLVHYDEERASGVVPVPVTTFPMGYPVLVGAIQAAGLSGEQAALIVSLLSALGCIFVLDLLARQLSLSTTARHWVLAVFVAGSWTPSLAASVLSEMAFTFATLGALALLVAAFDPANDRGRQAGLAVAAGMALGAAYWLRYAGLFVLLGLVPVAVLAQASKQHRAAVRPLFIAFCVGGLIMSVGMIRNIMLMGTWRGGNTKTVDHGALEIAHEFGVAIRDLVFGTPRMSEWIALRSMLFLLLAAGLVAGVVLFLQRAKRDPRSPIQIDFAAAALLLVTASYGACLTYAAARTGISYGARYFFPVLPVVALLAGLLITRIDAVSAPSLRWRALWTAVGASYALLHLNLFYREPAPDLHVKVAKRLDTTVFDATTARQAILSLAGPEDVIMANVGQATGYVLHRPTISLIGARLSAVEWTEANVRDAMKRFSVKTLVVHKAGPDDSVLPFPSPFIEHLATGAAPRWLQRVGESEAVVIYRPGAGL